MVVDLHWRWAVESETASGPVKSHAGPVGVQATKTADKARWPEEVANQTGSSCQN